MEDKNKEETRSTEQHTENDLESSDDTTASAEETTDEQDTDSEDKTDEQIEAQKENDAEKVNEKDDEDEAEEDVEKLRKKIETLTDENERLMDRLMRLQAEYENYKRRTEKERMDERKYEAENLAKELLPVLDNFERALLTEVSEENKSFLEGMEMIYKQLNDALASQGIKPIETKDQMFDPNYHHAVMQTEDENYESNMIVEELQKGYLLKDKVLRAAMVKVNK